MTMIVMNIGGMPVYLFGCIVAAGLLAGLLLVRWSAWLYEETFAVAVDILLAAILLGLVGARAGYVLLNWPDFVLQPAEIWRLWEGGYSTYGAGIGFLTAVFLTCRTRGASAWRWLDIFTPSLTLLLVFYAFSTFLLQAVIGTPLPLNLPNDHTLAEYVEFGYRPSGFEEYRYFRPVALYQTGLYLAIFLGIMFMTLPEARGRLWQPGGLFLITAFAAAMVRFASGFFYLSTLPGLHRGQILALLFAGAALLTFWRRQRRPREKVKKERT